MDNPANLLWGVAPFLVLALGAAALLSAVAALFRGHPMRAGRRVVEGGLLLAVGGAAVLAGANILTYSRLAYESPVAEISVRATEPAQKLYSVSLRRLDGSGRTSTCTLEGDEWILSGRVQTWRPWANILGLDATYTLDQLANKYVSAAEANGRPITACDISGQPEINNYLPEGWRAWLLSLAFAEQRRFGSANYMPLADGAVYRVLMTQRGLNSEPVNAAARAANARN